MAKRAVIAAFAVALMWTAAWASVDPNPPSIRSDTGAWPLRRQWTPAETQHWAAWLTHLYKMKTRGTPEQRRAKLERVLADPEMNLLLDPAFAGEDANPQIPVGVMRAMHSVLDCGKLTVALSSYYACRRGLPWMVAHVRTGGGDLRTAAYTIPAGSLSSFAAESLETFFVNAVTGLSTGNFRVELNNTNSELSDTVPVAIDRRYLIPGCLQYLDGHVLVLADVTPYGELKFLDATTDPSRNIYSFNGMNAVMGIPPKKSDRPGHEYRGCFQGLRVFRYPLAETDAAGRVINVRRRTDEEMKEFGFSPEQYDKIEEIVKTQHIVDNGMTLDSFHELIQRRLRTADTIVPAKLINECAEEIFALFSKREELVYAAWRDVLANGPIPFPDGDAEDNIFSCGGRWGVFATAASDLELRNRYHDLADTLDNMVRWYDREPEFVDLTGFEKYYIVNRDDVARAVIHFKGRVFSQEVLRYRNSVGQEVPLTLLDIEQRLHDLSFDPNHPPELRWGARLDSAESVHALQAPMPTPLSNGSLKVPMDEAYRLEAYYRALNREEFDKTSLRGALTQGFSARDPFDHQLGQWVVNPSRIPPLTPAGWLSAGRRPAG